MSAAKSAMARVGRDDIRAFGARVAGSAAQTMPGAPTDENGDQMAGFVSRVNYGGEPLIVVGLVHGREQKTLTLSPAEADDFCRDLADAVLWQNEELRRKAGQRVH